MQETEAKYYTNFTVHDFLRKSLND